MQINLSNYLTLNEKIRKRGVLFVNKLGDVAGGDNKDGDEPEGSGLVDVVHDLNHILRLKI